MTLTATGANQEIKFDPTNIASLHKGAYTVAMLIETPADVLTAYGLWTASAGGFAKRSAAISGGHLFSFNDFSDGFGTLLPNRHYRIVQRKAAGTKLVYWSIYDEDADEPAWVHGTANNAVTFGDSSADAAAIDTFSVGQGASFGAGYKGGFSLVGVWQSNLSDEQVEAAFTSAAQDLWDATPALLVLAPEADADSALVDVMGGDGEVADSRTAGWAASADPAGYDWTIDTESPGGGTDVVPAIFVSDGAEWQPMGSSGSSDPIAAGTVLANITGGSAAPTAVTLDALVTALALAVADVSGAAPTASPTFTGSATFSGRAVVTPDALTDAATIVVNASNGNDFRVTLTGDHTLGNPSNAVDGQRMLFVIEQDGTGGHSLTLDTKFNDPNGYYMGVATAAGATSYLGVVYHAGRDEFDVLAFAAGY